MEMITWKQVQIKSWFVEQNDIFQPNYSSLKIGFTAKPIKRRNNFYQSLNQNPQLNNANNIKSNPNHNFLLKKNSNQHRMINSRTNKKIASPPKSHKRQIGLKLGYTFCVSWIAKDVETKKFEFPSICGLFSGNKQGKTNPKQTRKR